MDLRGPITVDLISVQHYDHVMYKLVTTLDNISLNVIYTLTGNLV